MNIIVTKNKVDYSGSFLKVMKLEDVEGIVGTIDVLVYNNSNESSESKITYLGKLKDRVNKMLYICNEKNTDVAVKMMVIGSDGKYFDDEFFLESSTELNNLINSLDEVTQLAELGGVNVLSDFFNRYLKNGSSSFNSNYLAVVKEAVNNLLEEYNQKNFEIVQMSETATDIFSNTSALLVSMRKEKESMQKIVSKMAEAAKESSNSPKVSGVGPAILFYPRVNYMKEKSIIRIKDIDNCKFIMSFVLGLRIYLESVKNVRPKVIVIEPVGGVFEEIYKGYPWVKTSTHKSLSNYYNKVVFTNYPTKDVLSRLLDDTDYDVFIVLDRTVSDKQHILNSKGPSVKYGIGGESAIDKFKLSMKCCFSSIFEIPGVMFTIPVYPDYPKEKSARERFYISELTKEYDKLLVDVRRL